MTMSARFNSRRTRQRFRDEALAGRLDVAVDPAFATYSSEDPLAEEIVIAQIWKGRQRVNHIRVTLKRFDGRPIIDVRQFFVTADGRSQPTTRGVAVGIEKLPELARAFEKAYRQALDLNLIEAAQ